MQTYTMTFTEDEAELLGYALTKTKQRLQKRYDANPNSYRAEDIKWKASVIEGLRTRLDLLSPNKSAA